MIKAIRTAAFAAFIIASTYAYAQNGVNSPYSRYGFGLMADRSMGFNKAMGGIAQGYSDGQTINTANPASYSACDSLTALFDFGLSLQNGNYKQGGLQQNAKNSSFDYAAFHFRAVKGVGVAVSILPVTNIGYSFSSQSEALQGTNNVSSSYSFNGNGGLHQIMLGTGWRIVKPLSIGVNFGYIYGDYNHTMSNTFSESSVNSITRNYTADISTYSLDFGVQYTQPLSTKDKVVVGATYGLGHDISSSAYRSTMNYNTSLGTSRTTVDTLKNAFQLPSSLSAGVAFYHSYNLVAGADFEIQKWSNVRFPEQTNSGGTSTYTAMTGIFNDRIKYSAGIAYTPDPYASSYGQRITYKVGGYYSQTYANAENAGSFSSKPHEFGLSAGFTFPITNQNTTWSGSTPKIHLTFQWVHTNVPYLSSATNAESSLTENYLKLSLGLTVSDRWFHKWRVK